MIMTDVNVVYVYARMTSENRRINKPKTGVINLLRTVACVSTTEQKNSFLIAISVYFPFYVLCMRQVELRFDSRTYKW